MVNIKEKSFKDKLPLLPLRDIVVFPNMIVPLLVGRNKSLRAVDASENSFGRFIFFSTQKNLNIDEPALEDVYSVGTVAEILQVFKLPDGSVKILVEGRQRAEIEKFLDEKDFFKVKIKPLEIKNKKSLNAQALMRSVQSLFEEYAKLNKKIPPEAVVNSKNIEAPEQFGNIISSHLLVKIADKQKLLEIQDIEERLRFLANVLNTENEIIRVEKRIMGDVKRQMEQAQKDFYLQEQLKAIEKELGRKDENCGEIEGLRKKINKTRMPQAVKEITVRELNKLSKMMPFTPEAAVSRNYIDWLISLPWVKKTADKLDIKTAYRILEEDHYGLEKPKERILEYLAVRKLSDKPRAQILCLAGPPGVGKTSLAKSIARALGRKFVRVSLGGIKDEAEIRGHRRTYVGALPGRIIQSIKKAGTKNPVFLLDEVDKMSADFRGDPTSALLEVLDSEQNHSFSDHYLEVDFDLSEVMFIATSNLSENIPLPLRDRMEIIKLSGYTDYEKIKIAKMFLLPKQIKSCGLGENMLEISEETIMKIIRSYTREAGVRNLEREFAAICRRIARDIVENDKKEVKIEITAENLHEFLNAPRFNDDRISKTGEIGVVTGLAWTEVGGDVMRIETSIFKGKGKILLTGKLGEVMKESAQAALSYIRSKAKVLNLADDFYRKTDIHIHIPEGAIPKDGPSAGITMATALISSLTKKPVVKDIAMTGEITLRGHVLGIGGLKAKILAAHRAGIRKILIPKENDKDLQEIPAGIKKDLDVILVENMDEVIEIVFLNEKNKKKEPLDNKRNDSRKNKGLVSPGLRIQQVPVNLKGR